MSSDSPAAQDSASNRLPFELMTELSSVGTASTWIARTLGTGSDPADIRLNEVLRLNSHVTEKPELTEAVLRDVAQARRLNHPKAVRVNDAVSIGKELFIATDLVEGESLSTLITASGVEGLGTDVILRIGLDVLEALSAAHALSPEPLVHGELSPQQIVVGPDGIARVSGFGIARALAKVDASGAKNQARLGYAAPERVKGMSGPANGKDAGPLEPRSDLFSTAVILWECIAKQRLFAAKMDAAVIQKVLTAPIAPLASIPRVQVSPSVDAALLKALERDPARRYKSAADFSAALQKAGPSGIASHEKVASLVERFAGRSIAARRTQLATALNAPTTARGAAIARAADAPQPEPKRATQGTLLGMPQLTPAQILAAAQEREKTAQAQQAAVASPPANETAKMSKATQNQEIIDEATVDDEWNDAPAAAPPALPFVKPAAEASPPAAKPIAPIVPAAGKPAPAATTAAKAPVVAPPQAAKPAASATPAAKPAASATPIAKPAASATPVAKPAASTTPVAKPAASAPPPASTPPSASADKAGAKGRFQVAMPPPSTRTPAKTPVPPADNDAGAAVKVSATAKVEEPKPAAATPAAPAPAAKATPAAPAAKPAAPAKPAPPTKPTEDAAKPAPAAAKPAAPPKPGTLKPTTVPPVNVRKDEGGKPATPSKPDIAAAKSPAATEAAAAAKPGIPPAPPPAAARPAAARPPAPPPVEVTAVPASKTPISDPGSLGSVEIDSSPGAAGGRGRMAEALDRVGPGSTLGRYEILMPVAKGGMASVWAARLQGTRGFQKIVAIKTMLPDVSDDPEFESMFLDEARVAARIRHPNVVEIYDLGEQEDVLYIVMEWIDGETMTTVQKAAKPLGGIPLPILLRLASQVCAGLHSAHELRDDNGVLLDLVHRDISPGNVLISSSGFVKVADFGIAKSKGRLHVTRGAGVLKGKTPYLSPEQLRGMPIDRRSDIFSLGTLLYVMTTGLHPFRAEGEAKTMENIALLKTAPIREIVPNVHPEWEKIITKALEKDRANRFATAAEMQRAIDHLASSIGEPTTDEDVAAFVQKAIGDSLKERARNLRAAIAAADGPLSTSAPSSQVAAAAPAASLEAKSSPAKIDAPEAEKPAAAAAPAPFEDITIDEEVPEETAKEAVSAAAPSTPPRDGALVVPIPTSSKPGDLNAPKVMLSPDLTAKPASDAAAKSGEDALAAGGVGLLGWPSDKPKLPASTPSPVVAAALPDVRNDGTLSETPFVKGEEDPFAPPKRRKVLPIAIASAMVLGLAVGVITFAGGKKTGPSAAPERTGTEAIVTPTAAAAPDALKPADTPAATATAEAAPAAPSATAETAASAEPAASAPEPAAEPPAAPDPPDTDPPVAAAAPTTPAKSGAAVRPVNTATSKPTPAKPTPVKPGPGKPKPTPPKPTPKYNPSGI